jgi:hypothetical protein
MSLIETLLSGLGGGVVALAGAAWLTKKWISQRLKSEIETHKSQLVQKSEVLKTELSIYAHEQNVGLSRIDAQQSESILSIWKLLTEWHEVFLSITAPNRNLVEDFPNTVSRYNIWSRTLMDTSNKLSIEVRNRAIFFNPTAYETIARCGGSITEVTNRYYADTFEGINRGLGAEPDYEALISQIDVAREQLREASEESINELRDALSTEFRILMRAEK